MKVLLASVCLETGTDIQLALYYLKGYLLKNNPRARVTIRVFNENESVPAITRAILALGADLIGFSCYLWNIEKILRVSRRLKRACPGMTIVLGGPEASPRAQELLAREKAIDAVVRGEGDMSFARFVFGVRAEAPGVTYRLGRTIIHNPDSPRGLSLHDIPSPYLSGLVKLKDKRIVDVPLETMRGCASRCHYCYYHKNFPVLRYFPLSRVRRELKLILRHKPREVYLMDPTFNANAARAKEILKIVIRHNRGSCVHVELKAELIDEEMARLLSRANANNIEIGIQSTNSRTLRAINRGFNKEKFIKGIRYLNKYKLYYEIQLIDALPYQSYENLLASLDWLYSLNPAKVVIFRLSVLPGTALREKAAWFGIEYDRGAPYLARKSNAMTRQDVKNAERLAYAMDRLYDSGVFRKTLYAFKARTGVKISTILEDWVVWESRFKRHPADYPEFLNRKSPVFLEYLCRKHGYRQLYARFVPDLLKELCATPA